MDLFILFLAFLAGIPTGLFIVWLRMGDRPFYDFHEWPAETEKRLRERRERIATKEFAGY